MPSGPRPAHQVEHPLQARAVVAEGPGQELPGVDEVLGGEGVACHRRLRTSGSRRRQPGPDLVQRAPQDGEQLVDLRLGDDERRRQHDGAARAAGRSGRSAAPGAPPAPRRRGGRRTAALVRLSATISSAPMRPTPRASPTMGWSAIAASRAWNSGRHPLDIGEDAAVEELVEHGEPDGAADRVAAGGEAGGELVVLRRRLGHALRHRGRQDDGAHREEAARDHLGGDDDVGLDPVGERAPEPAGSPEAADHLVGDQRHAVLLAAPAGSPGSSPWAAG